MIELKKKVHQLCFNKVLERIKALEVELKSLKESASSDTKSSMGDKYETSREMINLEKGKIAGQLGEAVEMHTILSSLDVDSTPKQIGLGTLVVTDIAKFYLSVPLGPFETNEGNVFAISPGSPVGRQLLTKQIGAEIKVGSSIQTVVSII